MHCSVRRSMPAALLASCCFLPCLTAGAEEAAPALAACGSGEEPAVGAGGPPLPEPASLADKVIGRIVVRAGNVFDPSRDGEDRAVFRFFNRLRHRTREAVIRRQLLFRSGEPYSPRLLQESARLLRANRYLYEAEICTLGVEGNRVDVAVVTRDVWTLIPSASFTRSGGEDSVRFEVEDYNLLGTGKELAFKYSSNVDRDVSLYRYRDPHVLGSRVRMELETQENSDGDLHRIYLERPFYSLKTRWASGLTGFAEERRDPLYRNGEVFRELGHEVDFAQAHYGRSFRPTDRWTRRWLAGFTYEAHRFFEPELEATPASPLPEDRTLAYPWLAVQLVEDRFIETMRVEKIGRTEDLNLGLAFRARLGWSSSAFGADEDSAVFGLALERGWAPREGWLVFGDAQTAGRWAGSGPENFTAGASVRLFWRNFGDHLFFARLGVDGSRDLDPERQLLLGGDNGLRGYPLRLQEGDRRVLFTLEQRFYSRRHLFKLLRVGAAAFFDVGRAWFEGATGSESPWLKDVGLGLRLTSSRSGRANVLHLDVAFPLDSTESIESVQWLVTTKETF